MNMRVKNGGDDLILNRLLTHLNRSLPFTVHEIKQIRDHVYYMDTEQKPFILKGFSSIQRLQLQEAFTNSLKSEGFENTYSFYSFFEQPIFLNHRYFGFIEFIEANPRAFTYHFHHNRKEGLDLLHCFHNTTRMLSKQFELFLPRFNLLEKWQERTNLFLANIPFIRYYLKKEMLDELLVWANESLEGLRAENHSSRDENNVILHGDVAHHNFLKASTDKLYLIDFDLISIGDESADLLQYANRILPFLDWSLSRLSEYPLIKTYLNRRAFLWALMYPTDIFREWNRMIKDRTYQQPNKMLMVMNLTISQFHLRQQFIKELKNVVK